MFKKYIDRFKLLFELPFYYRGYMFRAGLFLAFPRLGSYYQSKKLRAWQKVKPKQASEDALRDCFVTEIPNIRAGIGHTLSEYITGRIWAKKMGLNYAHCPLTEPWESQFHFCGDAPTVESLKKKGLRFYKMPRLPNHPDQLDFTEIREKWCRIAENGPTCFVLGDGQNANDIAYASQELRQLYRTSPDFEQRLDLRQNGKVNVSVHVRRRNQADMLNPSVQDTNSDAYKARYLEGNYFLSICQIIEKTLGADQVHFNVFSQGEASAFSDFEVLKNFRLCLDTDQYETFHNLTLSDILIVSPSSFSFKAGMLSSGLKLARYPWWHEVPEDSEWCRIPEEPKIEAERISKFIQTNLPTAQTNAAKVFPFAL